MNIRFVEESQREFLDAISAYEEARKGLGQRFKDEADRCILWISDHPELYRLRPGAYRRINLRIFPYYIPYHHQETNSLDFSGSSCEPETALLDFQTGQTPLISFRKVS